MKHPVFFRIATKREKFLLLYSGLEPLGHVGGYTFYECPRKGDETTLYAVNEEGVWGKTHFWEVPDLEEITQ